MQPLHTETCDLAYTAQTDLLMNSDRMIKLGHSDLIYGSKSHAEKSGREWAFSSIQPMGCLFFSVRSRDSDIHTIKPLKCVSEFTECRRNDDLTHCVRSICYCT